MEPRTASDSNSPTVEISNATLRFGARTIWSELSLSVQPGEFLAVLGPNGSGKTTLLRVILGLEQLVTGDVTYGQRLQPSPRHKIGYIPQHNAFDASLPFRGIDLVHLGVDGDRYGLVRHNNDTHQAIADAIEEVGATSYAKKPIGLLSGGEQQRLRVAQALVAQPALLLCDEPLVSLDLHHQQAVADLIHSQTEKTQTSVVFVTHEINPIISFVDRVLYVVDGKWAVGTVEEVLNSESLSKLYGSEVDVIKVRDRIVIVGASDASHHDHFNAHSDVSGHVH